MFTTGGDDRSGMGFTIMESFMDTLKVRSRAGLGTTVTMLRRISVRANMSDGADGAGPSACRKER